MKKDLKVGDELLALVDILRKNGLETCFYSSGIESEADKEKPAYTLFKPNSITFAETEATSLFIKALLMLNYKYMSQADKSIFRLPLMEVTYTFNGKQFEYTVKGINSSTYYTFIFILTEVIKMYDDLKKETI